uniref:SGNH hydrolase-type esterase domain-containing protein n=1 Tax=Sinocyclocheilus rhinocerous TaxID=307959 RepID=A0A673LWB2_9TELE
MTELNAVLNDTSKIQDTFNSAVLIGSAGMGVQFSALLASTLPVQEPCMDSLAKELSPPLISDATAVRRSTDSCSTPCPREYQWKWVTGAGKRAMHETQPPQKLKLANRFSVLWLSLPSYGAKPAVHCFPAAKVLDIHTKLSDVLGKHANTVIAHVGSNDTSCRESETLKQHFKSLLISLTNTGKNIAISGPLPTFNKGIEKFSRLLSFNTWLKSTYDKYKVIFIDNFDLFWGRQALFRRDGLHPNQRGCQMLAHHIEQHILS